MRILDLSLLFPGPYCSQTPRARPAPTGSISFVFLLAVVAHIRHAATPYDELLAGGYDRRAARARVAGRVVQLLAALTTGPIGL